MLRMNKDEVLGLLQRGHARRTDIERIVRPEDMSEIADVVIERVAALLAVGDRATADAYLRRAVHIDISALELYEATVRSLGG